MNSIDFYKNKKGFTYTDIAKKTGYSTAYISMLAKGKRMNPGIEVMRKIASILDVTIDELIKKRG